MDNEILLIVLYVDDLILTRSSSDLILGLKAKLKDKFEIRHLDLLHFFLGIQVLQLDDGIFISQPEVCIGSFEEIQYGGLQVLFYSVLVESDAS